jgi:hypothetical protein
VTVPIREVPHGHSPPSLWQGPSGDTGAACPPTAAAAVEPAAGCDPDPGPGHNHLVPQVLAEEGDSMPLPLGFDSASESAPEQLADQPTDLVVADTEGNGGEGGGGGGGGEVTRSASLPQDQSGQGDDVPVSASPPQDPGGMGSSPPGPGTGSGAQAQLDGVIGDAAAAAVFGRLGGEELGGEERDAPANDELLDQVEGLLQGPVNDHAVLEAAGRLLRDAALRELSRDQRARATALLGTYQDAYRHLGLEPPADPPCPCSNPRSG